MTSNVTTTPTPIESYSFIYTYASSNGAQSYKGTGYAPLGTYTNGKTINITGTNNTTIGTYTISSVNDNIPYASNKVNHVTITEYDNGTSKYTSANGLSSPQSSGLNGLGSEGGSLTVAGSTSPLYFYDLHAAFHS